MIVIKFNAQVIIVIKFNAQVIIVIKFIAFGFSSQLPDCKGWSQLLD